MILRIPGSFRSTTSVLDASSALFADSQAKDHVLFFHCRIQSHVERGSVWAGLTVALCQVQCQIFSLVRAVIQRVEVQCHERPDLAQLVLLPRRWARCTLALPSSG